MQPSLAQAIARLALAGEQAGISVEEMIQILNEGASVEALLDFIGRNLPGSEADHPAGEHGSAA